MDEKITKKCPKCSAIVEVGTGGEKNLLHHQRSKACRMASVKSNNILSYYQLQPPPLHASQAPPTRPPIATLVLPMLAIEQEDAEVEQNSSNHPALSSLPAGTSISHQSKDPVVTLLSSICKLSISLPDSVPMAIESDPIACLGKSGAAYVERYTLLDDTSEDWENHINPALHAMWSKSDAEMWDMMRRGPNGTRGYCAVLEYFITERGAQSAIMEARVERLRVAIEHLWV